MSPRARWTGAASAWPLAARKNIGPAGLTMVVVREDLLGHALSRLPQRL